MADQSHIRAAYRAMTDLSLRLSRCRKPIGKRISFLAAALLCSSCYDSKNPDPGKPLGAVPRSAGVQIDQYDAETAAMEFFEEHGGGSKITRHSFEALMHLEPLKAGSTLSGYFLFGKIDYKDRNGVRHGPMRIMVYFAPDLRPTLILYDYPDRGTYAATSVCDEARRGVAARE